VKYMLLIYDNAGTRELFGSEEGRELREQLDALMAELTESGELVGGQALADPSNTKTVRMRDGAPVVTDGPLAEAKEHFGGYIVVDVESVERAVEIAARWPNEKMEVRPLMDGGGEEM
jgi:hypothetical protein